MKLRHIFLIIGLTAVVLLFVFCGREIIAANEPLNLDTKTHKVTSPTTIDFSTATILGLPVPTPAPAPVQSVFGRTGAILAQSDDYNIGQITGANAVNWDAAFADRLKWDGDATGLNPVTGRSSLGLVIGTNVQAWDTDLDTWATKTPYAGNLVIAAGKTLTANASITLLGNDAARLNVIGAGQFVLDGGGTSARLNIITNKTATISNSLTFAGTDNSTLNIGAGGTLGSAAFTASSAYEVPLTFAQSLSRSTNTVTLSGDSAAPGNSQYYGTNLSGTKGYFALPAGGTGTVTSFSAGSLSPLFTTSVDTATTTPALSFVLSSATQNQFLGRTALGTGVPSYQQIPFSALSGAASTGQGGVAAGGSTGQILIKNSATNYDVGWGTPATGDVIGPGGAADLGIAIFSGVTGKLLADSGRSIETTLSGATSKVPTSSAVKTYVDSTGVTSISSGNFSPLFNVTVTNASTTPALSFAAQTAGAGTVFANNTTASAVPAFVTNPRITAIANLTGNGFVKTSGGTGALSIDTSSYITGNQSITLSGDATGSGTTSINVTNTSVNGITYPATAALNTVPLVTSANTTATYTATTGTGNIVRSASPTFTGTAVFATINPTTISGSTTIQRPVTIQGTNTNDDAAAGVIGETVSSNLISSSATALVGSTNKNVTSISLTAGDWDVRGIINYLGAAIPPNVQQGLTGQISTTSAAQPDDGEQCYTAVAHSVGTNQSWLASTPLPPRRISLASTTTVYLVARAVFASGSWSAFGYIEARRMR